MGEKPAPGPPGGKGGPPPRPRRPRPPPMRPGLGPPVILSILQPERDSVGVGGGGWESVEEGGSGWRWVGVDGVEGETGKQLEKGLEGNGVVSQLI